MRSRSRSCPTVRRIGSKVFVADVVRIHYHDREAYAPSLTAQKHSHFEGVERARNVLLRIAVGKLSIVRSQFRLRRAYS